jgi:O-antigen ligase
MAVVKSAEPRPGPAATPGTGWRELWWGSGRLQWLLLLMAAPWLLVDIERGWLGLVLLGAQQVVRLTSANRPDWRLDLDLLWPAVGLGGMAMVGFLVSARPDLSSPKLFGIFFGIGVYSAAISTLRRVPPCEYPRLVLTAAIAFLSLGTVLAVVAFLLSAPREQWNGRLGATGIREAAPPNAVNGWRPMLLPELRSSQGIRTPVHPNELAGTLTLFLPIAVALLVHRSGRANGSGKHRAEQGGWWTRRARQTVTQVPWIASAIMGVVLVLTRSRGGLLAVLVSSAILLVSRTRLGRTRLVWGIPVAAVIGAGLLGLFLVVETTIDEQAIAKTALARLVMLGRTDDMFRSVALRLDLWQALVELLARYPWTGIGLNTLPTYFQDAASPFSQRLQVPLRFHLFPHAHNLFLQTALDLGLPGLVCLFALLGMAGRRLWQGLGRLGGTPCEAVVVGVAAALLAHLLFSLTDAITLGAKPGVFLWLLLGVAVSLPTSCPTGIAGDAASEPSQH